MRWRLGRDPGSCEACGAELERGAAWCGSCGARADGGGPGGAGQPVVAAEPEAVEDDPGTAAPHWSRNRTAVVALVVALAALVVATRPGDGPAEPLLGQLGERTGVSATGPPPSGLRLAWAHEPTADDSHMVSTGPPRGIVVGGDTLRLGSHVVDLQGGHLLRVVAHGAHLADGEWAIVEAGELVVLDTVTGEVRHRAAVSGDWVHRNPWSIRRWGGVSLFGLEQGNVLVGDDGSVVAEVEGTMMDHVDRAIEAPAAFPVRQVSTDHFAAFEELATPVRLVAAATGEVVLDLADDRARVVDVVGDLAMVAGTDARVDAFTSPAATSDVAWTVRLVDARTGEERARLDVEAREPPRLLGAFDDGTAVLATRSGGTFTLRAIGPDGSTSTIARAQPPPRRTDTGLHVRSTSLNAAAVAGDVLVVSAGEDGLVGLDRAGRRLWTLQAPMFAGLRAGGDHVAVLPDDGGRIRVVAAADGEVVASLSTEGRRWEAADTPIAALDGHVGLAPGQPFSRREQALGSTTWLDLRTGEPATLDDVLGRFLPGADDAPVDRAWTWHGTVLTPVAEGGGETGGVEPVLTRSRPDRVLELLEPGDTTTSFRLPIPDVGEEFGRGITSVGASAERMAVWSEGFDDPRAMATHILDRAAGTTTTVEEVRGIALVGDLLLAEEIDETWSVTTLVAIDAATGARRWSVEPADRQPRLESPLVDRELLVDLGVARVDARSLRDGTPRWAHASDTELSEHAVLGPRHVLVATTGGEVVALARDDGAVAWRTAVGAPVASITGAGDHVLVGTHTGLVVHLDGRGREVQRIAVGTGPVRAVAALGAAVVASVDGEVVGLRADGTGITRDDEVDLP